jgi:hypothetical protein
MASAGPSLGMEFFGLRRNTDGMNGLFIVGRAVVCSGLGFLMVLLVVFFPIFRRADFLERAAAEQHGAASTALHVRRY